MGNLPSISTSIPNWIVKIQAKNGYNFAMKYYDLVDHILLLRQVIAHPEMMQETEILHHSIDDYCQRMAQREMTYKFQQSKLPWQIDWIWHIHPLHPINYHRDCTQQLTYGELVDKKFQQLIQYSDTTLNSSPSLSTRTEHNILFVPSVDLVRAVLRQNEFVNEFKNHSLYSLELTKMSGLTFEKMVHNYIYFILLARNKELIVPTFDIDLMWHTHMRYPLRYEEDLKALCGYMVNHNDSIESDVLKKGLKQTAERWEMNYQTSYGKHTDRNNRQLIVCGSSCATVSPYFAEQRSEESSSNRFINADGFFESNSDGGSGGSCGGCGGGD